MKYPSLISLVLASSILTGCAEFPTSYSRIQQDKARVLDFIYEPSEAAPGDTVLLKAIFAGRPLAPEALTWGMSKKVVVNNYGVESALDTVPLEIMPEACTFSDRTSCIAFRFVIPKDVVADSPLIPDDWTASVPDYYRKQLPQNLLDMSKSGMLTMLENASSLSSPGNNSSTAALLPLLLQCFTVPIRIYCVIKNDHTIIDDYRVRYNSRFASIPEFRIPVNRNPRIDSVGVYIVHKASLSSFDPSAGKYSFDFMRIIDSGSTEIAIDDNNTYFMFPFIGDVDSTLSLDAAMGSGTWLPEKYEFQWFLQFDKQEMDKGSPYDLADFGATQLVAGQYLSRFHPSKNKAITSCTVWLEAGDDFVNEYFRPIGSTLKELRLRFTYK
jgi:hypothetical protein